MPGCIGHAEMDDFAAPAFDQRQDYLLWGQRSDRRHHLSPAGLIEDAGEVGQRVFDLPPALKRARENIAVLADCDRRPVVTVERRGKVAAAVAIDPARARRGADDPQLRRGLPGEDAGALEARGIETIPHLTTRDANLIGLQALLLGGWSVGGVRNVLAVTGDPPTLGDHPDTNGVYEIDAIGLVKVLARLNRGTDWAGKALGGATNFTIGVALNPVAEDLDYEIKRFREKVEEA